MENNGKIMGKRGNNGKNSENKGKIAKIMGEKA
jgi:hypothetical protein